MRRPLRKSVLRSILFTGVVLVAAVTVEAQQPKKIPRIGVLVPTSPSIYAARIKAFQQGLHEHGYIDGKNIMLEYRYAEGKVERFPELATELIGLKIDVMVTASEGTVRAAKKASSTIPIVFATVSDPVGSGLVASLARLLDWEVGGLSAFQYLVYICGGTTEHIAPVWSVTHQATVLSPTWIVAY